MCYTTYIKNGGVIVNVGTVLVTLIFITVISIIMYKFYIYIIKKTVKEVLKEVEEEKNKDTIIK